MRIRWRGLELPPQVVLDKSVSTPTYGKFVIEPFERGFGTTVGNSLRRILLSSLEGAAVSAIKIAGADHEFTSLEGVLEDVTEIVLNVKSLIIKMEDDQPRKLKINVNKKGEVTAADIESDANVTVLNPTQLICTLTKQRKFEMWLEVRIGRGYVTAAENTRPDQEIGVIPVDSVFSPVTRVRYATEDCRVGQRTNYDKLLMEIWSNGTLTPEMSLVEAAKILRKHLNPFVQYFELGTRVAPALSDLDAPAVDEGLEAKLNMSIHELDLSVRATNCLESANVNTVRELVQMTDRTLLELRSFGKTSLDEVKRKLADLGLSLRQEPEEEIIDEEGDEEEEDKAEGDEPAAPEEPKA
ncbi:MAG: DNA-directed RNA polymerase subunit alpha [Phycisphaerae bacterium]|nr:DNA-directed RNA polymerase subunit alpha [Phycisphaerae bacterium]